MGLEVESGIKIEDEETWYFRTLGNVHDYLLHRCGPTVETPYRTLSGLARAIVAINHDAFPASKTRIVEHDPVWRGSAK